MDGLRITYEGSPGLAGALAQILEEEGLEVRYTPPPEYRSLGDHVDTVVFFVLYKVGEAVTDAAKDALRARVGRALDRFRKRFPRGRATVEDDDEG